MCRYRTNVPEIRAARDNDGVNFAAELLREAPEGIGGQAETITRFAPRAYRAIAKTVGEPLETPLHIAATSRAHD